MDRYRPSGDIGDGHTRGRLIQQSFLQRTPRGRVATATIWRHFGLEMPGNGTGQLWKE